MADLSIVAAALAESSVIAHTSVLPSKSLFETHVR
jgi:hypothetical protein